MSLRAQLALLAVAAVCLPLVVVVMYSVNGSSNLSWPPHGVSLRWFRLIFDEQAVGIQLPLAVELAVTHCDPATRGNSATGRTKPATLETGLVVQVPEYLEQGVRIKVDTRTGEFLSRASG